MTAKSKDRWLERQEERLAAGNEAAGASPPGDTPQARLLRAARSGGFEALVAQARPAEPASMVTPEERETALREAGQWPAEKAAPPPETSPEATPAPAPTRELTPGEAYAAEHCRWVPVHEREHRRTTSTYGRLMTEYDPLTGEIIGDGYARDDEDDEW